MERINPKVIVATTTIKISEKSVEVNPQNRLPKITEIKLIAMLVSKVITIIA